MMFQEFAGQALGQLLGGGGSNDMAARQLYSQTGFCPCCRRYNKKNADRFMAWIMQEREERMASLPQRYADFVKRLDAAKKRAGLADVQP